MNDTLDDIALRITAYRHGTMDDAEYKASVKSILEAWLTVNNNKEDELP